MNADANVIPRPAARDPANCAGLICSTQTVADLLLLSERRVQQLAKEGLIPREGPGKYRLGSAVQAYVEYLRRETVSGMSAHGAGNEKMRLLKAKADLAELEVARVVGELVLARDVEALWSTLIVQFRNRMLSIPHRAAPLVVATQDAAEANKIVECLVLEALEELSR
jgi:phage terminase Nu1 subunit (DNA packaging protein)